MQHVKHAACRAALHGSFSSPTLVFRGFSRGGAFVRKRQGLHVSNPRQRQTGRKAGTQSQGPAKCLPAAWLPKG